MRLKNKIYSGANNKSSLYDLTLPETFSGKVVLFVHGYMGFKDWGCWNLVEDYFINLGFGFCKYNVSHNGCTINDPLNFNDLESFSTNNYSNECADFNAIIEEISQQYQPLNDLYVIGHSRGGGIALLTAEHPKVKKVATWAAISDIGSRFQTGTELEAWKESGFYYRKNGRTNQEMPHHFSQYTDFKAHEKELNIECAVRNFTKPLLLIHGDADTSVLPLEGEELAEWSGRKLNLINDTAHTFDSTHPWKSEKLPQKLEDVCRITAEFFLSSEKN